jgi:hypothetical protein
VCTAKERNIALPDGVTLDDTLLYDVELLDHYRVRVRPPLRLSQGSSHGFSVALPWL